MARTLGDIVRGLLNRGRKEDKTQPDTNRSPLANKNKGSQGSKEEEENSSPYSRAMSFASKLFAPLTNLFKNLWKAVFGGNDDTSKKIENPQEYAAITEGESAKEKSDDFRSLDTSMPSQSTAQTQVLSGQTASQGQASPPRTEEPPPNMGPVSSTVSQPQTQRSAAPTQPAAQQTQRSAPPTQPAGQQTQRAAAPTQPAAQQTQRAATPIQPVAAAPKNESTPSTASAKQTVTPTKPLTLTNRIIEAGKVMGVDYEKREWNGESTIPSSKVNQVKAINKHYSEYKEGHFRNKQFDINKEVEKYDPPQQKLVMELREEEALYELNRNINAKEGLDVSETLPDMDYSGEDRIADTSTFSQAKTTVYSTVDETKARQRLDELKQANSNLESAFKQNIQNTINHYENSSPSELLNESIDERMANLKKSDKNAKLTDSDDPKKKLQSLKDAYNSNKENKINAAVEEKTKAVNGRGAQARYGLTEIQKTQSIDLAREDSRYHSNQTIVYKEGITNPYTGRFYERLPQDTSQRINALKDANNTLEKAIDDKFEKEFKTLAEHPIKLTNNEQQDKSTERTVEPAQDQVSKKEETSNNMTTPSSSASTSTSSIIDAPSRESSAPPPAPAASEQTASPTAQILL